MAKAVSACIGEEVYLCNIANSQVAASYCPARPGASTMNSRNFANAVRIGDFEVGERESRQR